MRTTLHMGIHNNVMLDYTPSRTEISPEPKRDADGVAANVRAFFDKHSVTVQRVATLAACLSHATEGLKLNMLPALEDDTLFEQLVDEVWLREPAVIEHVLYLIWGNTKKLAALVKKSEAKRGALLTSLIQASAKS
ncbi:DUF6138 family protein [Pectobacterium sp. A5351]|uniref:DUF6138 family protein n=1 Tax=Pectobacterium sp. A5351 TaxID=2914983 RepID=UPI002330F8A2|nr:DUF6138 family protein [Pectobacterium sp. A5351]WCG82650.1 DUF6138 family protein [Pectobacterium sp. A5351]